MLMYSAKLFTESLNHLIPPPGPDETIFQRLFADVLPLNFTNFIQPLFYLHFWQISDYA